MPLVWSFVAGLPLGPLVLGALPLHPPASWLLAAGVVSGLALAAAVGALTRRGPWEARRAQRLARGASAGLLAWPALGTAALGLVPGPRPTAAAVLLVLGLSLARASRARGPLRSRVRHAAAVLAAELLFALALAVAGGVAAGVGAPPVERDVRFANAALDVDARVPLRADPRCTSEVRRVTPLLDHGAHPRLGPQGETLWLDAERGGRRQVERLELSTGTLSCTTCGEDGNNRRPAPSPNGRSLAFESDRHRSLRHPANTEIQEIDDVDRAAGRVSRRLTYEPSPDSHPIYDPTGRGLVWSSGRGAGFQVVRASLQTGHGGLLLSGRRVLAAGGSGWVAPAAWSADARALVVVRGVPVRPLEAERIDPAGGAPVHVASDLAGAGAIGFSADGSRMALAATLPTGAESLLPGRSGFLVGRLLPALGIADPGPGPGRTEVRVGPTSGPLATVQLGAVAEWGTPSGIALAPGGDAFALGQRRRGPDGVEERIVWVEIACERSRRADARTGAPAGAR